MLSPVCPGLTSYPLELLGLLMPPVERQPLTLTWRVAPRTTLGISGSSNVQRNNDEGAAIDLRSGYRDNATVHTLAVSVNGDPAFKYRARQLA